MKLPVTRILDVFVPPDIKEFEKSEELERARALICIELIVTSFALLSLIGCGIFLDLSHFNSAYLDRAIVTLIAGIPGYLFSLWIFRRTGSHAVSGNVFAFTFYAVILIGSLTLSEQKLFSYILYLLALPLLVSIIGNYVSGIVWIIMVALAPILLNIFGNTHFEQIFLWNWIAYCAVLFVAIYISNNYLKRMSQRLNTQCTWFEFAAAHDPLTGIANRATFDRRLQECIELCKLHGTKAVLVYIDLDKFKPINDTYGHQAGDAVLSAVADRLRQLVRRTDTVARLGGDEFAIIFDQCNPESIQLLIQRIEAVIKEPIEVSNNVLSVGCSVGVVVYPNDGLQADQLAQKADERMYQAKRKVEVS